MAKKSVQLLAFGSVISQSIFNTMQILSFIVF